MTLAQIMRLALRQLDEDPADIDEYHDEFRYYANEGYQIVLRDYLKPRETFVVHTDDRGRANVEGFGVIRIVEAREKDHRYQVMYDLTGDGTSIITPMRDKDIELLCEVERPDMVKDTDAPNMPEGTHGALADYICFRHLSNGNMAKQSRAQHFQRMFYEAMRRVRHDGLGSVTRMRNLYTVTDARWRG